VGHNFFYVLGHQENTYLVNWPIRKSILFYFYWFPLNSFARISWGTIYNRKHCLFLPNLDCCLFRKCSCELWRMENFRRNILN